MTDLLIIAYYTTEAYAKEADRLEASLRALGLDYWIHEEDVPGDWQAATRHKPEFLMLSRTAFDGPLLYVDVDAVFHSDPREMLDALPCCEVAAHNFRNQWLSGTLFLPDRRKTEDFLERWYQEDRANPDEPPAGFAVQPQKVMGRVIDSGEFLAEELPPELCWIFDLSPEFYGEGHTPVIEHLQASREHRPGRVDKVAVTRRQKRIAELDAMACA